MIKAGLLSFNVGPNSGMPIATIRFRRVNDNLTVCPFLTTVYQAAEMNRIAHERRADLGVVNY